MIQKEPGNTKVHGLRVKHFYEANFNLLLGVKWCQLAHHCINSNLINPWHFRGLPGRYATIPSSSKNSNGLFRGQAIGLSCVWTLMPPAATTTLSQTQPAWPDGALANTVPFASSTLNSLKSPIHSQDKARTLRKSLLPLQMPFDFWHWPEQLECPFIWVLIFSRLFDDHATKAKGVTFLSTDGAIKTQIYIVGFVNDSANCISDFTNPSQDVATLLHNSQHDAQLWNDLLVSRRDSRGPIFHQWRHESCM
ncbi:hypothetical protein IV203_033650 [Nitzschia inconspicua]|uniref:Uncharacterized protein n=1 Tax=Nitzschia inconspicua TaxID=303405 RepID=A0A9K3Q6Y0_9STRA|nr:hypothetical protein IV203_033650 [Nitzschia inconspicua]